MCGRMQWRNGTEGEGGGRREEGRCDRCGRCRTNMIFTHTQTQVWLLIHGFHKHEHNYMASYFYIHVLHKCTNHCMASCFHIIIWLLVSTYMDIIIWLLIFTYMNIIIIYNCCMASYLWLLISTHTHTHTHWFLIPRLPPTATIAVVTTSWQKMEGGYVWRSVQISSTLTTGCGAVSPVSQAVKPVVRAPCPMWIRRMAVWNVAASNLTETAVRYTQHFVLHACTCTCTYPLLSYVILYVYYIHSFFQLHFICIFLQVCIIHTVHMYMLIHV